MANEIILPLGITGQVGLYARLIFNGTLGNSIALTEISGSNGVYTNSLNLNGLTTGASYSVVAYDINNDLIASFGPLIWDGNDFVNVLPIATETLATAVWGNENRSLTEFDKTGYTLSAQGVLAVWRTLLSDLSETGTIGRLISQKLNVTGTLAHSDDAARYQGTSSGGSGGLTGVPDNFEKLVIDENGKLDVKVVDYSVGNSPEEALNQYQVVTYVGLEEALSGLELGAYESIETTLDELKEQSEASARDVTLTRRAVNVLTTEITRWREGIENSNKIMQTLTTLVRRLLT